MNTPNSLISAPAPLSLAETTTLPLLLKAFTGEAMERPPVWMMRQAGRYMHEYQAVRKRASFLEICKTPEIAIEVTLQPIEAFGFDASIVFSDILIPVEAMGLRLEFTDAQGPRFLDTVRSQEAVNALKIPDPWEDTGFVMKALQGLRREYSGTGIALIGFSGAPWTLACYAVEGQSWKTGGHIKSWLMEDPKAVHSLLEKLTQTVITYLCAQIEAGAEVLQLFDTWAGMVASQYYPEFVHAYHQKVIAGVKAKHPNVPILLFVKGSRGLLPLISQTGADGLSIDELTPLPQAREQVGPSLTLQGNLDSTALLVKNPDTLTPLVEAILKQSSPDKVMSRFIFNLGHGVLPPTPREHVQHVVKLVQSWSSSQQRFI